MAVEPGEVFGFLGPNGAGKTTTIRTLLDLLHPTRGSARIFGLDSQRDSVAIRARLGNLPGDFGYGKLATGRQAVSLLARLRGMDDLGRTEISRRRASVPTSSGPSVSSRAGNRQKIGLILAALPRARSAHSRRADERTRSADAGGVPGAWCARSAKRGCAVFLSSHELDEVERVCDRVGIIRDGRLIAVERVGDLLDRTPRRASVQFAEDDRRD